MAYKIRDFSAKSGIVHETDLLSAKDRLFLFVERNRRAILGGVALLVIAVLVLGAVIWSEKQNSREALVLEGKAQHLYVDRALDKPEETQENFGKAADLYRQILDEYPRTTSARRSLYLLGNILMEQGDFAGAIESYQRLVEQHDTDDLLLGLVYQRLGYAHLANKNQEAAYQAFSDALSLPNALNKDQVLFDVAKLEEADGNTEKALSHYKQLMEQYPTSPYTKEASLRVKILSPEEEPEGESEPVVQDEKAKGAATVKDEANDSGVKAEEQKQ